MARIRTLLLLALAMITLSAAPASATTTTPVNLSTRFGGTLSGRAAVHLFPTLWKARARVKGLPQGSYHLHLVATRTFFDNQGHPIGTTSVDYSICGMRVAKAGALGACHGKHLNPNWQYRTGDVITAEIVGQNLDITAPLH